MSNMSNVNSVPQTICRMYYLRSLLLPIKNTGRTIASFPHVLSDGTNKTFITKTYYYMFQAVPALSNIFFWDCCSKEL